jgi:broad specificity phosphatase PhoE
MEIWLVRHGDTIVAEDGLYQPHHGLTELGFEQARSVAGVLADVDFDGCYSSALPRAVQTAQVFADLTSRNFTRISELNEIEVGQIADASVEFKKNVVNHRVDLDFSRFGGESPSAFSARIHRGFGHLLEDAEAMNYQRVVGFLHGGTIGAILDYIAGREFDYRSRPRMPNCSYTVMKRSPGGRWSEFDGWRSDHLTKIT